MAETGLVYHHRQVGYSIVAWMLAGVGVTVAVGAILWSMPSGIPRTSALTLDAVVLLILASAAIIFSTLTVKIGGGQLSWHFTGHVVRKTLPLASIAEARETANSRWYGWGIRETPEGRLYNVSGLGAVEIRMRDGSAILLGSDEPEKLVRALNIGALS